MARRKREKIIEAALFKNVISPLSNVGPIDWPAYFGNRHPHTLELGCGAGRYTIGIAELDPAKNVIGVDIKGARIWRGAKEALQKKLSNAIFLRTKIEDLGRYFEPQSVAEIWITFPDPFPRKKQAKHRLTSPIFLPLYKQLLTSAGTVHLKTDDSDLFRYSIEAVAAASGKILVKTDDLYSTGPLSDILCLKTRYEDRHLAAGKTIKYLSWKW